MLRFCLDRIRATIDDFTTNLNEVQESIETEEKSTMGDKYETGRAMAQQEQERIQRQLGEARKDYQMLKNPSMSARHQKAQSGSLITTDKRVIYLGPGMGVINVNGKSIITTSMQSPLAQVFLDCTKGDQVEFRGQTETVLSVE